MSLTPIYTNTYEKPVIIAPDFTAGRFVFTEELYLNVDCNNILDWNISFTADGVIDYDLQYFYNLRGVLT